MLPVLLWVSSSSYTFSIFHYSSFIQQRSNILLYVSIINSKGSSWFQNYLCKLRFILHSVLNYWECCVLKYFCTYTQMYRNYHFLVPPTLKPGPWHPLFCPFLTNNLYCLLVNPPMLHYAAVMQLKALMVPKLAVKKIRMKWLCKLCLQSNEDATKGQNIVKEGKWK